MSTKKPSQNLPESNGSGAMPFKNHNPNQNHNAKKEALGPNTKR